jgi:TatD DNase family protein
MLGRLKKRMKEESHFILTDTHAHLASTRFAGQVSEVIARAAAAGVERIVTISCDVEDSLTNLSLARTYPGVYPTAGIHPSYVHEIERDTWFADISRIASEPEVVAIGEIGMDYYHPPGDGGTVEKWRRRQREVFARLLQLALDLRKPVVVHQRECGGDVMEVLADFPGVTAVLHCFTGTVIEAERALGLGHYLSYTGVLTYKNGEAVREAARITPLDRVMVETDAPYLAPVPFRGKPCEPAMVEFTARTLADVHGLSYEEVCQLTSRNASTFFGLPPSGERGSPLLHG